MWDKGGFAGFNPPSLGLGSPFSDLRGPSIFGDRDLFSRELGSFHDKLLSDADPLIARWRREAKEEEEER